MDRYGVEAANGTRKVNNERFVEIITMGEKEKGGYTGAGTVYAIGREEISYEQVDG